MNKIEQMVVWTKLITSIYPTYPIAGHSASLVQCPDDICNLLGGVGEYIARLHQQEKNGFAQELQKL